MVDCAEQVWDDVQVLELAEQVAVARTQGRAQAERVALLPKRQVRLFLRRLWEYAGGLGSATAPPSLVVEAPLADDVTGLLRRFDVAVARRDVGGQVELSVPGGADRTRFLTEIALPAWAEAPFGQPPQFATIATGPAPRHVWSPAHSLSAGVRD